LAEGSTKRSFKDKIRFYEIAFASLREIQSLIDAEDLCDLKVKAHALGGCLYKLVNQPPPP
jgi:four helix bundle protein